MTDDASCRARPDPRVVRAQQRLGAARRRHAGGVGGRRRVPGARRLPRGTRRVVRARAGQLEADARRARALTTCGSVHDRDRDPFPAAPPSRRCSCPGWSSWPAPRRTSCARTCPVARSTPARREQVILAVTEVNGCRYCAWIHGSWADYLGELEDPADVLEALLAHARASAEAGQPLDTAPLAERPARRGRRPACGPRWPRSRWPTWWATPSTGCWPAPPAAARSTRSGPPASWPPWRSRCRSPCRCWPSAARCALAASAGARRARGAACRRPARPTSSSTCSPAPCPATSPTPACGSRCCACPVPLAVRHHGRPHRGHACASGGATIDGRQRHRARTRALVVEGDVEPLLQLATGHLVREIGTPARQAAVTRGARWPSSSAPTTSTTRPTGSRTSPSTRPARPTLTVSPGHPRGGRRRHAVGGGRGRRRHAGGGRVQRRRHRHPARRDRPRPQAPRPASRSTPTR